MSESVSPSHHHWSLSPTPGRFCPGQSEPVDLSKGSWPSLTHLPVGPGLRRTLVSATILPPAPLGGPLACRQGRTAAIWPPPTGRCLQEQPWRCPGLPPLASATHDRLACGKKTLFLNWISAMNWTLQVSILKWHNLRWSKSNSATLPYS